MTQNEPQNAKFSEQIKENSKNNLKRFAAEKDKIRKNCKSAFGAKGLELRLSRRKKKKK